jgi:hypothetical protein
MYCKYVDFPLSLSLSPSGDVRTVVIVTRNKVCELILAESRICIAHVCLLLTQSIILPKFLFLLFFPGLSGSSWFVFLTFVSFHNHGPTKHFTRHPGDRYNTRSRSSRSVS